MLARYPDKSGHKHTHTQQMHWLWKLCPLLQPHRRYGRKQQWLFTWKIDDASALPLTFLSWVLSRSIFFRRRFHIVVYPQRTMTFFGRASEKNWGSSPWKVTYFLWWLFIDVFHALFSAMDNFRAFGVRWLFQEQSCCYYFGFFSLSYHGRLQGKLNASG